MQDHFQGSPDRYEIGIVGDLISIESFLTILSEQSQHDKFNSLEVVAYALPCENPKFSTTDQRDEIPQYSSLTEMIQQHPNIGLVFEVTNSPAVIRHVRQNLPENVTLIERKSASFFLHLLSTDKMWMACRIDQMHSEAMLTAIVDQLKEEILFLDRDGLILNLNQTAEKSSGKKKREMIGQHYSLLFSNMETDSGIPLKECDCPLKKTIETGRPSDATASEVDSEGRMRYFRIYMYPIATGGKITHVIGMRRDITQRTQMEIRLQQAEKLASIGELSTYIAHEIRNPLFAISGFANSLLRSGIEDDNSLNKLNIILEESKRLDNILKSILNFARPTETKTGETDLNNLVDSTMSIMNYGCENQGIFVIIEKEDDLAKAKADSELMKQCLINLVKNSMEAMPGGGRIHIRTGMLKDRVFMQVEDTGKGIPPEIRDKIFSPFFSTKGSGSGLGLAMIRKICDDIGGKVELTSKVGMGTKVTIYLPPMLAVANSDQTE